MAFRHHWGGSSSIPRPVLFLLRTCADVRFSVQLPPKPAGDLKISARERANLPRALRARPQAAFGCRWPQTGGYQKLMVTFSRAPATYLPTICSVHVFLHAPSLFGGVFVFWGGVFARRRRAAHPPAFHRRSARDPHFAPHLCRTCAALVPHLCRI